MSSFLKFRFFSLLFLFSFHNQIFSQTDVFVTTFEDLNGNGNLNGGEPTDVVGLSLWQDTDLNGSYETLSPIVYNGTFFPAVPDGNYEIQYPSTSGLLNLLTGTPTSITIVLDGTPEPAYFVPYIEFSTIGDFVWEDLNGNGLQNGGEPGITGVSIDLNGTTGLGAPVNLNTISGVGGIYSFNNLEPGNYTLTFNTFAGYQRTVQTVDSDPNQTTGITAVVNITSGDNINTIDAGYYQFATVSDFVWEDLNGNGIQEGGEPGIDGVTVTLSGNDGAGNAVNQVDITAGGGIYEFNMVPPGTYLVTFTLPSANHFFTQPDATGDTQDSDANKVTGATINFVLVSDQVKSDVDAGMYRGATISDLVWEDLNGNGIQDGGEPGQAGVNVRLSGTDGAGNPVNLGPFASNGTGNYIFNNLAPGTYTITFGPLAANFFFSDADQTADTNDSDANPATGAAPPRLVVSNETVTDIDAGVFEAVSIGNFVWEDLNGNGIQDGGEPALNGVTVSIERSIGGAVTKANGAPATPVISGPGGAYLFDVLKPGSYIITFEAFAGHFRTLQGVGGPTLDSDGDVVTGRTAVITLISGDVNNNIDGGYFRGGRIGDFTWIDFNGDGIQNDPSGLAGVSINLTNNLGAAVNDALGAAIVPIISNGAGLFSFDNLRPGLYKLTFTAPGGFFPTRLNAAGGATDITDVDTDSDVDQGNANMTFDIEIVSGEVELGIDGGFYQPVRIGDFVWKDADGNGVQDAGEMGIAGVTIQLQNADASPLTDVTNGAVANQVTTGTGFYEFTNIRPGLYNIIVTAPAMHFFTDANIGGDDNLDSDFTNTGVITAPLQANSNQTINFIDAGLYKNITLSGTVWVEGDDNGIQTPPEGGAPGVVVDIITDPGGVVVGSTTTNGTGDYQFIIKPGNYIVSIVSGNFGTGNPLSGLVSCTPTADPNNDVDMDDNGGGPTSGPIVTTQINLRCGMEPGPPDNTSNSTIDFCFKFDCDQPNNLSAPSCDMVVDTFCNLTILDAGCARMPSPPLIGNAPDPLCPGGGTPHNMSWFAFIAGTGNYSIEVDPFACTPGGGGMLGIQAGIYTNCAFTNAVFCQSACSTAPINIPSNVLIPGNTYFFFLDGCSGSVCSYNINVNGTFNEYIIPEPTEVVCTSTTCSPVCPNTPLSFQVNAGYDNATLKFNWRVTSPSGVVTTFNTLQNTLNFTVTELGTYKIEIITISNKCNSTSTVRSIDILVKHPNDEDFGEKEICENFIAGYVGPSADASGNPDPNGDGFGGWQQTPFAFVPGVNTAMINGPGGCMYKQTVRIRELEISPEANLNLILCQEEIPYTVSPTFPFTINGPIVDQAVTLIGGGANGCDSLIRLNATVLEVLFGEVVQGDCIDGKTLFIFQNAVIPDPPVSHVIRWRRNSNGQLVNDGNPDGNTSTILLSIPGDYTCEVEMTLNGKKCISAFPFTFTPSSVLPSPQAINWPDVFCASVLNSTFVAESTEANPQFNWTFPAGVAVTGANTNTLRITWNNVPGGEVCVSIKDNCGESVPTCRTIVINPVPNADFDLEKTICIDSTARIYSVLPHVNGNIYNWNLNGGSIIATPGVNGVDSLEVKWNAAGKKIITLSVTRNGCTSPIVRDSLEIIPLQAIPTVECNTSATGVEFFWNPLPGQVGNPIITASHPGVLSGNNYTISGLLPGITVDISVVLSNNHACGSITAIGQCVTQDCTPEDVSFNPVSDICLDPTINQSIDLKAFVNSTTTNGTYNFTGPGITTAASGIFDPNIAGASSTPHQIRLVYRDVLGCFSPAAFLNIKVNTIPNALFIGDQNICLDSFATIEYTGNITSGGSFIWDFGSDVQQIKNGPGPFTIGWNNPGQKTITLSTALDGCTSPETEIKVNVAPRLNPIVITCAAVGPTNVSFDWNDVANSSAYLVTVNSVVTNVSQSRLDLTNLDVNESYTIEVEAVSANACPSVIASFTCATTDCPPVSIAFNQKDTTLCQNNNMPVINLIATISGGLQSPNQVLTWTGNGVTPGSIANTAIFNPNVAGVGSHTINFSLVDGTCKKDTSMVIDIIGKPLSTFTGDDLICIEDNYILTFTGTPNLALDWDLPTNVTINRITPTGNTYRVNFPNDGTFTFGLQVGTTPCVSDVSTLTVEVEPKLDTVKIECAQSTTQIVFNWDDIDCANQYQVRINNVLVGTQSTLSYTASNLVVGENVEIRILPISTCECPAIPTTLTCQAKNCPAITLQLNSPVDRYCQGSFTNPFPLSVVVTNSNGSGLGTWSGDQITPAGIFDPKDKSPGVYNFTYSFDEENCKFSEDISIEVYELPKLTLTTVQPECYDNNIGSAEPAVEGGKTPYTYILDNVNTVLPLDNLEPKLYNLIVLDDNKCSDTTDFQIIESIEPTIVVSGQTLILKGSSANLSFNITGLTSNLDSIVWKDSKNNTVCRGVDCNTVKVAPLSDETYCVYVYFNNECVVSDCIEVNVQDVIVITIPNVITIDGNNPVFFVQSFPNVSKVKSMKIYDRWGNNVFLKENVAAGDPSQGWDGRLNKSIVTQGVFVYTIELEMLDGKVELFNGDITVL